MSLLLLLLWYQSHATININVDGMDIVTKEGERHESLVEAAARDNAVRAKLNHARVATTSTRSRGG